MLVRVLTLVALRWVRLITLVYASCSTLVYAGCAVQLSFTPVVMVEALRESALELWQSSIYYGPWI